jgi:hypothetical protein
LSGEDKTSSAGIVQSISDNLGAFFRHLFPGILIMGAAYVAHPCWFSGIDTHSWQHIVIVAVITLASGNIWFAINRYAIHQFFDYVFYLFRSEGPAWTTSPFHYIDDVAQYTTDSLCLSSIPPRARQHIAFRASAILLLYTVAELGFLVTFWSEPCTLFAQHRCAVFIGSVSVFVAGLCQNIIARRIDFYFIKFGHGHD